MIRRTLTIVSLIGLLLNWRAFVLRFEKLFIGENEVIALIGVDIPEASLHVSIISGAHRASVQVW